MTDQPNMRGKWVMFAVLIAVALLMGSTTYLKVYFFGGP
jgi:hypothetical protein